MWLPASMHMSAEWKINENIRKRMVRDISELGRPAVITVAELGVNEKWGAADESISCLFDVLCAPFHVFFILRLS